MSAGITGFRGLCGGVLLSSVVALALPGCGDDDKPGQADAGADSGSDSGSDAGADTGQAPSCNVGTACAIDDDCADDGFCELELAITIPAQNLPNGTALESSLFPGGLCSPMPLDVYDSPTSRSCDFAAPLGQQGCGSCGVCMPEALSGEIYAICREACEPSASQTGCSRAGYTCDLAAGACVEGCRSDEECRLDLVDSDQNGTLDSYRFNPNSHAICDSTTLRCSHNGTSGATAGDACTRDEDCEADGRCILPQQTLAGFSFPGGYCSKRGCDVAGLECAGGDAACLEVRGAGQGLISTPHCMLTCQRGAEAEANVTGVDGHGAGCRTGYRCAWDGIHGVGPIDNGVCVGGNYNAIEDNNIGQACTANDQCYSPYGHGQCLRLSVGGVRAATAACTIMDCAAPGTPDDVCGEGAECIGLSGDASFCAQTCETAADCAEGLACADDDDDVGTPSICYPICFSADDCREGAECLDADGSATTSERICRAS